MILVDTDIFFEIILQQFQCTVGCKYVEDRQIGSELRGHKGVKTGLRS